MDPRLGKEAGKRIEEKRTAFKWAGEVDDDLEAVCWIAPEPWRTANDTEDSFDLYINFEGTDCIDEAAPETWVGQFLGFAGSGMRFAFGTNALSKVKWKALLRTDPIKQDLVELGFEVDARAGALDLPVKIDKDLLIAAFNDQDFDEALAPIGLSLDHIADARASSTASSRLSAHDPSPLRPASANRGRSQGRVRGLHRDAVALDKRLDAGDDHHRLLTALRRLDLAAAQQAINRGPTDRQQLGGLGHAHRQAIEQGDRRGRFGISTGHGRAFWNWRSLSRKALSMAGTSSATGSSTPYAAA